MREILAWILPKLTWKIKLGLVLVSWVIVGLTVQRVESWRYTSREAARLEKAAEALADSQAKADRVGANLEDAHSKYRETIRRIDDAPVATECYFDAERVRALTSINHAGQAPRKRYGKVSVLR